MGNANRDDARHVCVISARGQGGVQHAWEGAAAGGAQLGIL